MASFGKRTRRVLSDEAVDGLAEQIGMTNVARVLLVQVDEDAPNVERTTVVGRHLRRLIEPAVLEEPCHGPSRPVHGRIRSGRSSSGMPTNVTPASPTARALLALELIQATPGVTADQLAFELRVTERAARRYVAILREAGIRIDATTGPYGGYRIGRG